MGPVKKFGIEKIIANARRSMTHTTTRAVQTKLLGERLAEANGKCLSLLVVRNGSTPMSHKWYKLNRPNRQTPPSLSH
ncbi:hypothetical protein OPW39_15620 [Vibrio europaeus]|uniref:hypothetical protein n=1 Tax=Vibrio europaeus TaxID=300876 RepID=UPI00233EDF2F|nr:hypothetical protein [Vibrio europaeus]MDC5870236.1 hypothetical protein [Vibrio europaeus]